MNLLIGVTGSVATIKLNSLISAINSRFPQVEVKVVGTENSLKFLADFHQSCTILKDSDEWAMWGKIGDSILHIDLRNWADVYLIAPLDANTMAKLSTGLCDNLLTCVARAWDFQDGRKKIIVAPAMNTAMWNHPITGRQMMELESFGYEIIHPIEKKLACGDFGIGAMENVDKIIENLFIHLKDILEQSKID